MRIFIYARIEDDMNIPNRRYEDYPWDIFYKSNIYPINVTFDKNYNYEIEKIDFKILLNEGEKFNELDFYIGLEVIEFYDDQMSKSFTLTDIYLK